MKVYIGKQNIQDESFKLISDPAILNYIADDSECSEIILDTCLTRASSDEVIKIVNLCLQKLRINGKLKIIDFDFDLLVYAYQKANELENSQAKINNLVNLNKLFNNHPIGCFITIEFIKYLLKGHELKLTSASIDNVKFGLEYVRS